MSTVDFIHVFFFHDYAAGFTAGTDFFSVLEHEDDIVIRTVFVNISSKSSQPSRMTVVTALVAYAGIDGLPGSIDIVFHRDRIEISTEGNGLCFGIIASVSRIEPKTTIVDLQAGSILSHEFHQLFLGFYFFTGQLRMLVEPMS